MKKLNIFKVLFAATALAIALVGCGDLGEESPAQTQVTKDGKVGVSLSVKEDFRTLVSDVDTANLSYELVISDTADSNAEDYEAARVISLDSLDSSATVAYLTAGKNYSFALTGYKTIEGEKTPIIASRNAVKKTISADDAKVSIMLVALSGSKVNVSLTVSYASSYGVSDLAASVFTDGALTNGASDSLSLDSENEENSDKSDGKVVFTGEIETGSTRWVKIELKDGERTIGGKTLALYGIPTGDISGQVDASVKEYKASIKLTADTKPESLLLKNKEISKSDYTGISLTTESAEKPYIFTGYVPVGEYDVYNGETVIGQVTNTTALEVNTSVSLTGLSATWTESQPTFFAGAEGNDEAIKNALTVKATMSNGEEVISNYTIDYDNESTAEQKLLVSYTYNGVTKTATVSLKLTEVVLESIAVKTAPEKVTYTEGEELDLSGLVLNLVYNDVRKNAEVEYDEESANDFVVSGFDSSVPSASQTVTITYGGKEVTFDVEIKELVYNTILYPVGNKGKTVSIAENGTFAGLDNANAVLIYNQNILDENVTYAKLSATVNWQSTSGHIGLGLLNLTDCLYGDTAIISGAGIFATAQGIKGWGSTGLFTDGSASQNATTKKDYLISVEYTKTETGFTLVFTSEGTNGTSATFTQNNFTFPNGKPLYFALGASPTGTSNPKADNVLYSDVKVLVIGEGIEKSGKTHTVAGFAESLLTDSRTVLSPSETSVSYTIPSTESGNKGDSHEITLSNVSLDSIKALAATVEVEGSWTWDSEKVTLLADATSVKAKATFVPKDISTYKLISSQEFTINITDERAEKPEASVVSVTWNFANAAAISVYSTATADTENNTVKYSDSATYGTANTYLLSTSRSMALKIAGSYRDNANSAQINGDIYVPVSAGSILTIVPFNNSDYVSYEITLAGETTTGIINSVETATYTAKTAGFAKISCTQYLISIAVEDITRSDIVGFYGSESENIASFFTSPAPKLVISGKETVPAEETITLTATTENFTGTPTITWSSNDSTIATVSDSGVVTGVKEGSVTITASASLGEESASDTLTIAVTAAKEYVAAGAYNFSTNAVEGYTVDGKNNGTWSKQDANESQKHDKITITAKIDSSGANIKNSSSSAGYITFALKEAMSMTFTDISKKGIEIFSSDGTVNGNSVSNADFEAGKGSGKLGADGNETTVKLSEGTYYIYGATTSSAKVKTLTFASLSTTPDPNTTVVIGHDIPTDDISLSVAGSTVSVTLPSGVSKSASYEWLVDGYKQPDQSSESFTLSKVYYRNGYSDEEQTILPGQTFIVTARVTIGGLVYTKTTSLLYTGN
ncbi:Ig-like domain-containing protein [uncultured Treponema sp.]|uniref:Ig-like domain-containing protein n=1 Tax=uncultured Treponema sp. TaxID=162155 RepID=UPI0025F1B4D9|nr:Ig-like domain-containing protein [uncultured Treponema sp.]